MSSSEPSSKIGLLDTPEEVAKKLKKAVCVPREVEGNGVIAFVEHVILRILALKGKGIPKFVVDKGNGESLVYQDIAKLKQDYKQDIPTPQTIKPALIKTLNELLQPIREEFQRSEGWQLADKSGYPPEVKPTKPTKAKKAKKEMKEKLNCRQGSPI
ncbi:tyrosyl-trna synthetase [Fusarium sporotrichioides]|uniref:tyrosine--tRNA ligase n=1 Tax=Fusarium sporotrichioides TaxID=5514 RepID=A0A395S109_FUSSP|nr:tyrosyl-trna synthetase [Fusarium sporotrichioides]